MSRSYWIAAIALGLALLVSDDARGQEDQETSTADNAEVGQEQPTADEAPAGSTPVEATPTYIYYAPHSPPDPTNQDHYAEADLRVQRDMSRWTLIAALAAVAGAVISVIAVVLVYLTLREAARTSAAAIKSVESSDKAVIAAEATVKATREIGNRQLRPYMGPSDPKVVRDGDYISYFSVSIKNFGLSTAQNVQVEAIAAHAMRESAPLFDGKTYVREAVFCPGEAVEIKIEPESKAIDTIIHNGGMVIIEIKITYRDPIATKDELFRNVRLKFDGLDEFGQGGDLSIIAHGNTGN